MLPQELFPDDTARRTGRRAIEQCAQQVVVPKAQQAGDHGPLRCGENARHRKGLEQQRCSPAIAMMHLLELQDEPHLCRIEGLWNRRSATGQWSASGIWLAPAH
jgi:hypothetical protein